MVGSTHKQLKTNYSSQALALEEFIRYYKPKCWVGPIREFTFAPYITDEEVEVILSGAMPIKEKFEPWYIQEAIEAWKNESK